MTREEAQRRAALSAERAKAQLAERERRASDLAPELWRSGKSVSEVAAEIGCSRATVQRRLRAAGVRCDQAERNRRITQRHGTRVKWSPDMVAALVRAVEAVEAGLTRSVPTANNFRKRVLALLFCQ